MADPTDSDRAYGDRDPHSGRFAAGNQAARGNGSARQQTRLARAVRSALTDGELQQVLRALHTASLSGDSAAASVLLQHAVGRPREKQPTIEGVDLPASLDTPQSVQQALASLLRAAAAGDVDLDAARQLAELVEHVAQAGTLRELAQKVEDLERRSHT